MTRPTEQPASQPAVPPADGARWRGHTHKELYLMLHDGPGAAASAEPSRRWEGIATSLGEIGQDLQKALDNSSGAWSGKAAGAAYDRLSVTAAWATDTGADAAAMRAAVENQAENIARARADMPVPEDVPAAAPDPTLAPAVQVAKAHTDLEGVEATASSAEELAFEVMAAYELNTNTTTGGLSSFEAPAAIDHHDEVHQGQAMGTQHTHASGLLGGLLGGGHHGGHHSWHGSGTSGQSAPSWTEPEARTPSYLPERGTFSGVLDPIFGSGGRSEDRSRGGNSLFGGSNGSYSGGGYNGSGSGSGSGSGAGAGSGSGSEAHGAPAANGTSSVANGSSSGAAVPKTGVTNMGMPQGDLQAAAAGHAAAVHQASASTPVAPTTGAAAGGAQDRMAMRRFGMDAIGSNQWFEADEVVAVGESPRRRRDFKDDEQVIESVDILGEEHKLPPTVIGDGQDR